MGKTGFRIALAGKMRSGKDTVVGYLEDHYGFKKFAFAQGIKMVVAMLQIKTPERGKPRALYQGIGQDLRKYDPDVWVNNTLRSVGMFSEPGDNIVISDVRQPNEVEALREAGYIIVKIVSDDYERMDRMEDLGEEYTLSELLHETEKAVDTIEADFEIENNGTVEELFEAVEMLMEIIQAQQEGEE